MAKKGSSNGSGNGSLQVHLPVVSEPRCHICQSSARNMVDKLIAAQFSFKSIAEELMMHEDFKDKQEDSVRKNVERHAHRHVDIKSRAVRQMVERRAREQGILTETAEGQITTARAVLDMLVAKGAEYLGMPEAKVRMADVIEAVKILEDQQRSEYQSRLEVLERQMWAVGEALKFYVGSEMQLRTIVAGAEWLFDNPEKTLSEYERYKNPAIEANVVEDGEVVGDA